MLDNENDSIVTSETTTEPPRRRRRAASRPAGAPQQVAPPPAVQALPAPDAENVPVPVVREPAAAETVAQEPAAQQPMAEAVAPAAVEAPETDRTPRRRRAATTPEAEPAARRRRVKAVPAAAEAAVEQQPAVVEQQSALVEQPAEAAASEAAAPEAEAPKKPARRRATRRTAAPEPIVDEAPAPEVLPQEPATETAAPYEAPAEHPRSADGSAPEAPAEQPAVQEATRSRRRRATRPAAAAAPTATDGDELEAKLREAEERAEARKALLADPFITSESREARLAALAGAIAADDEPDADDDADDTPEQADSDDTAEESDDVADLDESSDDSEDDADDDSEDEASSDAGDDNAPARRRRRRGGRRRRRGSSGSDDSGDDSDEDSTSDDTEDSDDEAADDADSDSDTDSTDQGEGDDNGTTRRRRRSRRRRGESGSPEASSDGEVTGIEGSTRMEAKRQRRKESRAAGRRRPPILSEAEFLARREAVDRKLVIRQGEEYTQLAVVEDGILVEHYVDKASAASLIGNIYVGRVQNVLPSMEAAFIDIGRGRNAVLYAGEVDWASFGVTGEGRKVENVLKSGQSVLVQVTKDPVGAKGARLTSHISLPGRYIVYSPGGHLSGISRKLPDVERNRLRTVLGDLISDDESVIVRTAAEGASEEELIRDVNRLKAQWEVIEKKSKTGGAPQALYAEPDLTLRIVRDLFTEDFGKLIVQGDDVWDSITGYVSHVAPHLAERMERFEAADDEHDIFDEFRIDDQIAKALDRKVYLPSGGSLVIDRTEAMTVIDVNTGRFTGAGGNLEATVTENNLEAAEEIVRQVRLRDLGGIIVIDFIDMVLPSNRDLLLRRLVECLGRDRTRHQVAEVTSLGLVQMTRKRIGTGLHEAFTEECEHCKGAGYHRFEEPVDSQAPSDGGDRKQNRRRRR